MAIKPTIFKFDVTLSDMNRDYYDSLNLTVAQHPSETTERMMARVLVFCLNAEEFLSFTKGLSAVEEPDIWSQSLDGQTTLWIDVGEPAVDRMKKATRQAKVVKVYSFNSKSDVWWQQNQAKCADLDVSVFQFKWPDIQAVSALVERTMELSVTITGDSAYIATAAGESEVSWVSLQEKMQ